MSCVRKSNRSIKFRKLWATKKCEICLWDIDEYAIIKRNFSIQLLCFLNACDGIDDAAKVIATYYEIRTTCPSIFSNRDPMSPEIQQCFGSQWNFHLPNTPSNHSVIYHCLSSPRASDYVFNEACKTFFMTLGLALHRLFVFFDIDWFVLRFTSLFPGTFRRFDNHFRHAERRHETLTATEDGNAEKLLPISSRCATGEARVDAYCQLCFFLRHGADLDKTIYEEWNHSEGLRWKENNSMNL